MDYGPGLSSFCFLPQRKLPGRGNHLLIFPSVLSTGNVLFFLGHHSRVTFSSPKIYPEEAWQLLHSRQGNVCAGFVSESVCPSGEFEEKALSTVAVVVFPCT